ncbi:MAG: hypothetical protein GYA51_09025 [Candidatus Methanofastidiosa archaeon]|nr:hypothetical protein [Candidatus Methanofastidiosa archaeon]
MKEKNSAEYYLEALKTWQMMCLENKNTETILINKLRNTKYYLSSIDNPNISALAKSIEHLLRMNYVILKMYNLCNLLPMIFATSEDEDTKERFAATCGFDTTKEMLMTEFTMHSMSARELIELHWLGENIKEKDGQEED